METGSVQLFPIVRLQDNAKQLRKARQCFSHEGSLSLSTRPIIFSKVFFCVLFFLHVLISLWHPFLLHSFCYYRIHLWLLLVIQTSFILPQYVPTFFMPFNSLPKSNTALSTLKWFSRSHYHSFRLITNMIHFSHHFSGPRK